MLVIREIAARGIRPMTTLRLPALSVLALLAATTLAAAADAVRAPFIAGALPAVSAQNGKLGAFGGQIDSETILGLDGSFSVPLSHDWGAQVDGLAGTGGGSPFWGIGGHLFWRNPAQGLLGIYGSFVNWSDIGARVSKVGAEGQLYNGPWTFSALAAMQGGTFNGFAGNASLSYYVTPDFRLDGAYRFLNGEGSTGLIGAEWLVTRSGLALFATGTVGGSHDVFLAGGRVYLGTPGKSLADRQRQDDPPNELIQDLFKSLPQSIDCTT
jgi:hypothetical protein